MMRTTMQQGDRRLARFVTGSTLMLLALALSTFGMAPAAAQDAPDGGEGLDEGGLDDGEPIEIEASTLYVSPLTDALPPTLTQSVPPAAVCVVAPELCPDSIDPIRSGAAGAIGGAQDQGRDAPVQPIPSDSAAVSFFGGVTRYETALLFDAPAVPEGEDVMRFELTFPQSSPSYDASSPAFRRAVLAAFETISSRDPADFAEGLAAALTDEKPIDTSKVIAFEACPFTEAFTPGGAPQASDRSEMPQEDYDDEKVPAIDCTFGGNGVYDEEAEVWRVDLAFAAQAWAEGEIDNHGVLLRPIGAPNLAFGDADTTTNAQVVLDITEVTASLETAEGFDPGDFGDFDDPVTPEDDLGGDLGGGEFEADAPAFDDGGSGDLGAPLDSPDFSDGSAEDVPFDADAPEVADGLEADGEAGTQLDAQAARPAGSVPETPWWVWTLVPLLLGGAYLTGSAVLAPAPGLASASGSGGALTRMLAKHGTAS